MARACLLLLMLCLASQADADASRSGQRSELQVGGPLRIVKKEAGSGKTHVEERPAVPLSIGASPLLSDVVNTDGRIPTDLNSERAEDPGLAYALTASMSVGIGYNFIEAEDLVSDRAVDGIVDVDHRSHHLLFRALWHFE